MIVVLKMTEMAKMMLNDKEVNVITLGDKSVVFTIGNHSIDDNEFEAMGFKPVYAVSQRFEPIRGTYYSIGFKKYLIVAKYGVCVGEFGDNGFGYDEKDNCLVVIQTSKSGKMYIKYG